MSVIKRKISEFVNNHETQLIHLDEEIELNPVNKGNIWKHSVQLFQNVINELKKNYVGSVSVSLQIELISDARELKGVPKSEIELLELIDEFAMPEVIICLPIKELWQPKLEIYACPITFKLHGLEENIYILYEEYRTIEEMREEDQFTKWLTLSIQI